MVLVQRAVKLGRTKGLWPQSAGGFGTSSVSLPRMDAAPKRSAARAKPRKNALGREAWLNAARTALIRDGIGGVEVGKLARKLRATRGGFYWFFTSRKQLLDQLLADWEQTNTAKFKALLLDPGANGMTEFRALVDMWVNEDGYDPQWDAAVREWARISPRVAAVVHRVDDVRIGILQRIFEDMGYQNPEAFVRARISYFHQVGYYTLGVKESREQRLKLLPVYIRQLTGFDL
jgi:AcrR family transcriptional regulator